MKLKSLYLKLNNHLKEVKETRVSDSTAERVDLGIERKKMGMKGRDHQ